ncbi:MAG: serine/threonine-protein kinase [Myxococcota bacterium]
MSETSRPSSPSDVDALRATLEAQGIDVGGDAGQTLGSILRSPFRGDAADLSASADPDGVRPDLSLPPVSIGDGATDPLTNQPHDFRVRAELGRGGMGVVYLAEQRALRRDVAIKQLVDESAGLVDALVREATITGQLEHPNIVPVHSLVEGEHGPAVVMKRISGTEWRHLIEGRTAASGDPSEEQAPTERHLEILLQVCNAVAFAHSRGIVHRDIKPANVMIGEYGEVMLVDWGLAKRLGGPRSKRIAGTPAYLAPEMLKGIADERSDVFCLGATLHEVLVGRPRHEGARVVDVLAAAKKCAPYAYPNEVPEELAAICRKACARLPDDRFQSVGELREAILRYREHAAANAFASAGSARLGELEAAIDSGRTSYAEAQRLFGQARFAFEQALQAWPESPGASGGLSRTLERMARYEIRTQHPETAAALVAAMPAPSPELLAKVERALEVRAAERVRLEELEKDRDRSLGAEARARALALVGVVSVAITAGFVTLRVVYPEYASPATRLVFSGTLVLCVVAGIVTWWRGRGRGSWNLVNRRIAQITLLALSVSWVNRAVSLLADVAPARILLTDALILGMGGLALAPFHRAGPVLGALSFAVALVGALRPELIDGLFIALAVTLPALVLAWSRLGRGRRSLPPPARAPGHDPAE